MSQGILIHQIIEQLVQIQSQTWHVLMKVTEDEENGGESVKQFDAIVEGACIHKTDWVSMVS